MSNFSKLILIIVLCLGIWWGYDKFFSEKFPLPNFSTEEETKINTTEDEPVSKVEEDKPQKEPTKEQNNIYVYMLTTDKSGNQFLKPVARPLPPGKDKLSYAVKQLFVGPNKAESSKGVYSEVPNQAKLIGITTTDSKIIIDITGNFSYGGGSDSIYSRMRQLIKTSLANTDKPVYLHIDGKQVDVIGGEGISITQPLSENSLDE